MRACQQIAPIAVASVLHAEQRLTSRGQHAYAVARGIVIGQLIKPIEIIGLRVVALLIRIAGAHMKIAHTGRVVDEEMRKLRPYVVIVTFVGRLRKLVAVIFRPGRKVINAIERECVGRRPCIIGGSLDVDIVLFPIILSCT